MKLFLKGMSSDLLGRTRYLHILLKAEIKKVRLELSVTKRYEERKKNKLEVSNPHSRQRLRWFCREDVFGMDSSIEYWGIDNRTNLDEFLGAFSQMLSLKHIKFLDKTQSLFQRRSSFDLFTSRFSWSGLVPARTWRHEALRVCPTQRLKIRRQVAEMLGERTTASLDISSQVETLNLCMS